MPFEIDEVQAVLQKVLNSSSEPLPSKLSQISEFTKERKVLSAKGSARREVERMIKRRLTKESQSDTHEVINALAVARGIFPISSHDFKYFCVTELLKEVQRLSTDNARGSLRLKAIASNLAKDLVSKEQKIKLLSQTDPRLSPITLNSPLPLTPPSSSTTLSQRLVPFSPIHQLPTPSITPPKISLPLPKEDDLKPEALSVLARKQEEKNRSQADEFDELVPDITEFVRVESEPKNRRSGGYSYILRGTYTLNKTTIKVAIKYLKVDHEIDKETRCQRLSQRLRREIRSWHNLEHPNVSPFYGFIAEGEGPCNIGMVSPWYRNGDIKEYLKKHPKADRLEMLLGIAEGIQYLHEKDIIHGDIKGANIMIDDQKKPRLIDFGLTQQMRGPNYKSSGDTTSNVPHSLVWAAPEIIRAKNTSAWTKGSDVYAFASTCLEIMTGKRPYQDQLNSQQIEERVGEKKKYPDRPENPIISDKLWELLVSCWKPSEPSKRPDISRVRKKLSSLHKLTI